MATDPVCGMTVNPKALLESTSTRDRRIIFAASTV